MYNHLINFIDANKIVYKYQFGFRRSHSTNHTIISLAEKVSNAMDSEKISIGVFLDLRKAFDTFDSLYPTRQTLQIWYSRNTLELV